MSGLKELPLINFHRSLRAAGSSVCDLSARARVGRAHLTQVLTGKRSGAATWKHVLPLLTERQLFHLKQCSAWNNLAEREYQRINSTEPKAS